MLWVPPMQEIKFVTVHDMYLYAKENSTTLLPSSTADFWAIYTTEHERIDRYFDRTYKTYYFFDQPVNAKAEDVLPDFKNAISDLFLINLKKYTEWFRVNEVDDDVYSIIDNYDVTESREGSNNKRIIDSFGQKVGTSNYVTGQQTNTETDTVAPYDSENFANREQITNVRGQRTDTSANTLNPYTDNHTLNGSDEYTMSKKGNIGVQTQSEVMQKHVDFWKGFSFYKMLFEDIFTEYLLIDKGYI